MNDLSELLESEGLEDGELDALVAWASQRAETLVAAVGDDPELGPLLRAGGEAGPIPGASLEATAAPATPAADDVRDVSAAAERTGPDEPIPADLPRRPSLPPIPPEQPSYETASADDENEDDIEELDEVELLDDEDLELVEESMSGPAPSPPDEGEPEWRSALATAQEGDDLAEEARAANRTDDSTLTRLRPQEDELQEHEVDLSDLDAE